MEELEKNEMLDFIKKKENHKNNHTLFKWKKNIFFMLDNGAKQKTILEYIFLKDEKLKEKYKDRIPTAKSLLGQFIKAHYKEESASRNNHNKKNGSIKVLQNENSNLKALDKNKSLNSEKKIEIKHIDGTKHFYTHNYLINECVCKTGTSKKIDLLEKNIHVIPSVKNGIKYNFEDIKANIGSNKYNFDEYSLVIHINIAKSSALDVYRYLNGKLIFLQEVLYHQSSHLDELLDEKIKEFIESY